MMRTDTARILPFARSTPRTRATPASSGGRCGPRGRARRTPAGRVALTIEFDVERLRRPPHAGDGATAGASSPDAREEEPEAHDHPAALDVLPHLYTRARRRQTRFARDLQTQVQFLLRSRAGALVHAVVGRPARDAPALKSLEDLHTYRTIMGAWTWTALFQAVRDTRSYETGLDAGLLLLRAADHHQAQLSRREAVAHRTQLYWFVLATLDWLDRWDMYLETWEAIRACTAYALTERPGARQQYGAALTPFILREDAHGLTVHFLWLTRFRKAVIARKVQRRRHGHKLGNLWHTTQDELSAAELRESLRWSAQRARDAPARR